MNAPIDDVRPGHIIAVEMESGPEALAWVEYKREARETGEPYIRVTWLRPAARYVQGWFRDYRGQVSHAYEASLPDSPDAFGKQKYGSFRILPREEAFSLHIEWLYGPDPHEVMKRTMARVYEPITTTQTIIEQPQIIQQLDLWSKHKAS